MTEKPLKKYAEMLETKGLLKKAALSGEKAEQPVKYVSYNSIEVREGTLFICKGANFKKEYLDDAIQKGAVAYVAEKDMDADVDFPHLIVSDIRRAMSEIGAMFYESIWNESLQMIGVTGTKGKSTTVTFVKAIMDDYCKSRGKKEIGFLSGIYTYDGENKVKAKKMTTPETLQLHAHLAACVKNGCTALVMETSSQALKYCRTAALRYKVGAFLNISEDHISDREHPGFEDYFNSKLKIFEQSQIACINGDMERQYLQPVMEKARSCCQRVITFGKNEKADYRGYDIPSTPTSLTFKLKCEGVTESIRVSIGGLYNASNALAAIAIARAMGVPFENIKTGLANVKVAGRMELYTLPDKHVDVIVDYAHNKLSYQTLFENIKKLYPGRKIMLVFGCHGNKAYNRRKDLGELANKYADRIVLTEQDPGTESVEDICRQIMEYVDEDKLAAVIPDRGDAIKAACRMVEKNWVMVIAGNGADGYQKRGNKYIELPTDGERVQEYIESLI